jgi:hypothetical protein
LATTRAIRAIAIETHDSSFKLSTFVIGIPAALAASAFGFTISATFGRGWLLISLGGASSLARLAELSEVGSGSTIRTKDDSTAAVGPRF